MVKGVENQEYSIESLTALSSAMRSLQRCGSARDYGILVIPSVLGPPPKLKSEPSTLETLRARAFSLLSIAGVSGFCQVLLLNGNRLMFKGMYDLYIIFLCIVMTDANSDSPNHVDWDALGNDYCSVLNAGMVMFLSLEKRYFSRELLGKKSYIHEPFGTLGTKSNEMHHVDVMNSMDSRYFIDEGHQRFVISYPCRPKEVPAKLLENESEPNTGSTLELRSGQPSFPPRKKLNTVSTELSDYNTHTAKQ
ncbi:hypothetical protein LguiB_005778 [Lonicera macranthoides]